MSHSPVPFRRKMIGAVTRLFVRPFSRNKPPSKRVAIVIPMSSRTELTEEERISKLQLERHLGGYDRFLLVPEGVTHDFEGYRNIEFPKRFFGSAANHGKLLGTRAFYRAFLDYEFVFFYHFDSLVFSDQLEEWCDRGIDYIGPPWVKCEDSPWVTRPRVGNGGFTLLRVEAALKALTGRYVANPSFFWFDLFTAYAPAWFVKLLERIEWFWPARRLLREWREVHDPCAHNRNNDIFWSDKAVLYHPGFRVASLEDGLRFAFEVSPRTCFEMNGRRMPFGCHAWGRYDKTFWQPHLVTTSGGGGGNRKEAAFRA
jgi:hypothetical protein